MKSTIADPETLIYCIKIVAVDGTTLRFTEYPHDLRMSNGALYMSDQGYEFTSVTNTNDGGSLIDMEGILDTAGIDVTGLLTEKWDGARIYAFATSWAVPVEDEEPVSVGLIGKTVI